MVTVPAFLWRYGTIPRGVVLGLVVGGSLGALAWLDSGFLVIGLIVFVVLAVFYGVWMARRMMHHWPGAGQLSGPERELVARTARGGGRTEDPRLARAVIEYRDGLRAAAEAARPLRWLLWIVLVAAVGSALWDAAFGSWGNAVVSVIYLAMLGVEVFWWPERQRRLLGNADRAAETAEHVLERSRP